VSDEEHRWRFNGGRRDDSSWRLRGELGLRRLGAIMKIQGGGFTRYVNENGGWRGVGNAFSHIPGKGRQMSVRRGGAVAQVVIPARVEYHIVVDTRYYTLS
jgi:hypothetical protein